MLQLPMHQCKQIRQLAASDIEFFTSYVTGASWSPNRLAGDKIELSTNLKCLIGRWILREKWIQMRNAAIEFIKFYCCLIVSDCSWRCSHDLRHISWIVLSCLCSHLRLSISFYGRVVCQWKYATYLELCWQWIMYCILHTLIPLGLWQINCTL